MSSAASEFYKGKWQQHYQRRDAVEKLVRHWEREHEAMLKGLHEHVTREVMGAVRQKAQVAIARGGDQPVLRFTEREFDELMRAFVCQQRRYRHGPVEHFSQEQVKAQIDALCAVYGWSWVEGPPQRALPVKQSVGGGA